MIVQGTEGRDRQIEVLILQMCADTEVDLWQTAAKNSLVITGNLTVTINILIKTVTYVCTLLGCVLVQVFLCTGDTLILPSIELTDFLAYFGDIRASNIRFGTETK